MRQPTEMEVRVAEALQNESGPWMNELSAAQSLILARAAIAAMREPTAEMIPGERNNLGDPERPFVRDDDNLLREDWQAMIDAALSK